MELQDIQNNLDILKSIVSAVEVGSTFPKEWEKVHPDTKLQIKDLMSGLGSLLN